MLTLSSYKLQKLFVATDCYCYHKILSKKIFNYFGINSEKFEKKSKNFYSYRISLIINFYLKNFVTFCQVFFTFIALQKKFLNQIKKNFLV